MTLFADMEPVKVNAWLAWCQSHDWGTMPDWHPRVPQACYPWFDDMTGEMVTYSMEADGFELILTEARHKSPAELKAWAGY